MEQVFKVRVEVDIDFSSICPQGFIYESHSAHAAIRYGISLEIKDWGIKGISVWVPDQEIDIVIELLEKEEDSPESFDCKVNLKNCTIEAGLINLNSSIAPNSLNLTLKNFKMKPTHSSVEFEAEGEGELVFESQEAS
jgi:hypothetical protein